jgi:hypothetical protein
LSLKKFKYNFIELLGGLNINEKDAGIGAVLADVFKQLGKKVFQSLI